MGYWTWFAISFCVGLLTLLSGMFVGPNLPQSKRSWLANIYFKMAATCGRRVLLIRRKLGGYKLAPSSYDGEKEAEQATLNGEKEHFDDPERFMSRFNGKPFGLAYERSHAIVSPIVAEIGEVVEDIRENDAHKVQLETDDGGTVTAFNRTLALPKKQRLVDLAKIEYVLPGSGRPSLAETGYEYARKSQEGFNSRRAVEAIAIVIGFVAGFGIVFLAMREMGGGGVPGSNVQLAMNAMGVFW